MTGNVVLLGFALVGAPGFSVGASGAAIAAFAFGAIVGGRTGTRFGHRRDRLLSVAAGIQTGLFAISAALAALSGSSVPAGYRYSLIVLLAIAMGVQNSAARKLAVPDLTTTVLTMTITGFAADSSVAGGQGSKAGRRSLAVAAMLAGAVAGAVLVIHARIFYPLLIAVVVLAAVSGAATLLGGSGLAWADPDPDPGP